MKPLMTQAFWNNIEDSLLRMASQKTGGRTNVSAPGFLQPDGHFCVGTRSAGLVCVLHCFI